MAIIILNAIECPDKSDIQCFTYVSMMLQLQWRHCTFGCTYQAPLSLFCCRQDALFREGLLERNLLVLGKEHHAVLYYDLCTVCLKNIHSV